MRNELLKDPFYLLIYRIGFISFTAFTGIGLLIFLNRQWEDDNLKRRKDNLRFKNRLEKFYYVWGWLFLIWIMIILIGFLFELII